MIQEIKMPSAGQTTDEATIVTVNVKVGDTVKRGDVLLEAETDKAILPVESFAAGQVLDVLVQEGDSVTAGTLLAVVGKPEDAASYQEKLEGDCHAVLPKQPAGAVQAAPVPLLQEEYRPIVKGESPVKAAPGAAVSSAPVSPAPAMPNAKLLAREKHVDLSAVVPSNGQFIKRQDVLAAAAAGDGAKYEVKPMTRMRSVIGKRMRESLDIIPAWQCTVSINMEACMVLRDACRDQRGIKLSYNDILAKAIAVAARKYPLVNARYEQDEIRVYHHTHVGLAVALEDALVVPVVQDIDCKSLDEIAAAYRQQIQKAREGKLTPADMGCGSVTISNLGMYDVKQFTAIVNPPESCILAVGSIQVVPVWDGTAFQPVHEMTVTGSFDHRMIDGAYGAQFLREVKALMETPALMLC